MKQKIILTLTALALAMPLHARTWTSADGKSTFDGEYISSTETTVTVLKNGRQRTFKMGLLSEEDQKWAKETAARKATLDKEAAERGSLKDQKIGKKLMGKTVRLVDKKFVREDTTKVPEYYLVYFSASW